MQERILFTMDICLIISCVKDEVLQSETIKHKHSCIHISLRGSMSSIKQTSGVHKHALLGKGLLIWCIVITGKHTELDNRLGGIFCAEVFFGLCQCIFFTHAVGHMLCFLFFLEC